jgi:hypothetical protein
MILRLRRWWWDKMHETPLAMRAIGEQIQARQPVDGPQGGRWKEPEWITEDLKGRP